MNIYYTKEEIRENPSIKYFNEKDIEKFRRDGARFIIDLGTKLGLRYDTNATGVVYFHRFFMQYSFSEFDKYVTGACCLFLAGKVEETPKKSRDIIKMTKTILSEKDFAKFGDDPKEELMTLEKVILQTIHFDFNVAHPYTYLLKYMKTLKLAKSSLEMTPEHEAKLQKIVQMTWTFINDSLCTTLCLQWEPEIIAIALINLSARLTKYDIDSWFNCSLVASAKESPTSHWYEKFVTGLEPELLEDIAQHVLDLYSSSTNHKNSLLTSKSSTSNVSHTKIIDYESIMLSTNTTLTQQNEHSTASSLL